MSFMDILLKSNSKSVEDILKHQPIIEEIKKQLTVQESIIQYVERNRKKWEIESNSKLGRVISTRRLNAIFDKVKKENGITQLDTIDESLFFTEPERKTDVVPSTERVSASSRKGKQLMQHVLFQVSEVLKKSEDENTEEVEIVLAL